MPAGCERSTYIAGFNVPVGPAKVPFCLSVIRAHLNFNAGEFVILLPPPVLGEMLEMYAATEPVWGAVVHGMLGEGGENGMFAKYSWQNSSSKYGFAVDCGSTLSPDDAGLIM